MPTYQGATNYDLSGIYVWNYTEYTNTARGAKGVSILVADSLAHANGNQWTTVALSGGTNGANVLNQAPGGYADAEPGALYSLTTQAGGSVTNVAVLKSKSTALGGARTSVLTRCGWLDRPPPPPSQIRWCSWPRPWLACCATHGGSDDSNNNSLVRQLHCRPSDNSPLRPPLVGPAVQLPPQRQGWSGEGATPLSLCGRGAGGEGVGGTSGLSPRAPPSP